MKTIFLSTFFIVICCLPAWSQKDATVSGVVSSTEGEPIADAYIFLDKTNISSVSTEKGKYQFKVPQGDYTMMCSVLGFEKQIIQVKVTSGESVVHHFKLVRKDQVLDEVEIKGKSIIQEVKESAYNVATIDSKPLANRTVDLSEAMEKTAGVKIRRSGGVGSNTSVMLNGFTGKHVKIFIDGVPMNTYGSAFQINNIPINLAERIEIYKGVVPVELGADALGGAINIITKKTSSTYLDASYSYGSFNTHKSNINFGITGKKGLSLSVNAFQNYSDNNYKIKTQLLQLEEEGKSAVYTDEEYWFRRFHDTYHNEAIVGKVGVQGKSWADRLMAGFTYAQEYKEVQNGNLMKRAYGGIVRESDTKAASLEYFKNNLFTKNLDLKLSANYSHASNNNVDTLARLYNWKGEYMNQVKKGEYQYTLSEYNNNTGVVTANLKYAIGDKHLISINNLYSTFTRTARNEVGEASMSAADSIKKENVKDVLGISYQYKINEKWSVSAFQKNYFVSVTGPVDTVTIASNSSRYISQKRTFNTTGYGLITNYKLRPAVLLKLSYEKTVRVPNATELFGDELLEIGTASLDPEVSQNINFNVVYSPELPSGKHQVYVDAGFIYRNTKDFIRRMIDTEVASASYTNHGKVRTLGLDLEAHYAYRKKLTLGAAVTYQNIMNMEKYDELGRESIIYKDPMPNKPIFFMNADLGYKINNFIKAGNTLTCTYYLNFMDKFYRNFESLGSKSSKLFIDQQLSHDIGFTYVMASGKYNLGFEARNITNEMLYDNFSLQKPGRSFSMKARYFFSK